MTTGIFGGTFNPVHWGHVKTALEIKQTAGFDRMLLVPCGIPPHRERPEVSADSRLAMLRLAISDYPELEIDDRELSREGPSYSVDTLQALHDEMPGKSLAMCIGADAFLGLHTWHRWQDIFELSHIVVAHRPGWSLGEKKDDLPSPLRAEMSKRYVKDIMALNSKTAGLIIELDVEAIDISSSSIREKLHKNESITGLVPDNVEQYIDKHELYRG